MSDKEFKDSSIGKHISSNNNYEKDQTQSEMQCPFDQVLSDLNLIALLSPGQTISISSMTICNHNSWSTSLWRTYSGETRLNTITFIKDVFLRAFDLIENPQCCSDHTYNTDIIYNSINKALIGFESLKKTYHKDYYTIVDIDDVIKIIKEKLSTKRTFKLTFDILSSKTAEESNTKIEEAKIQEVLLGPFLIDHVIQEGKIDDMIDHVIQEGKIDDEGFKDSTILESKIKIRECIKELIDEKLSDNTDDEIQKNYPRTNESDEFLSTQENDEKLDKSENTSNIPEMVASSDRESNSETSKITIISNGPSNNTENTICLSDSNNIHIESSDNNLSSPIESSLNIIDIMREFSASDDLEVTKKFIKSLVESDKKDKASKEQEDSDQLGNNTALLNEFIKKTDVEYSKEPSTYESINEICSENNMESADGKNENITEQGKYVSEANGICSAGNDEIITRNLYEDIPTIPFCTDFWKCQGNTIDKTSPSPPIIKLAKAFKRWFEEIRLDSDDSDDSEEDNLLL